MPILIIRAGRWLGANRRSLNTVRSSDPNLGFLSTRNRNLNKSVFSLPVEQSVRLHQIRIQPNRFTNNPKTGTLNLVL